MSIAIVILGAISALVILEPWKGSALPIVSVFISDTPIETGQERPEALIQMARARLQEKVVLAGPDMTHNTSWATLGADVELNKLGRVLAELGQEDSPAARYNRFESDTPGKARISLPVSLESSAAVESLVAIKEIIDRKPKNARFEFKNNSISEEQIGRSLDVYETLHRLDMALVKGESEIEMSVATIPAAVTKDELAGIHVDAVAGFYETPYSRMRKDRDRTHNVRLGASMLDGQVILPGQLFSFNDILGDRSEARGFRYAPVIAGGAIVEGMGGGTCQVASTLYAAAFFSGLVVEDRQPHSRPSSYIKLGLDATVSYPALDLKIRNPFEYPVVIHFTVEDGLARVEIRAKERPFTVTLLRTVIDTRPFPIRVVDDSSIPRGQEIITQLGVPGYTVRRYKIVERDKVGFRFPSTDKYPPTVQFVRKGIASVEELKKSEKKPPKADGHKPYRASNSLRMVQGDGIWYESTHD